LLGYANFTVIEPDAAVFDGDHVILDALETP
jgi:hypothetical protein